ncbi:helix-turn-helix domain-containing protein [Microbacterium galbum]|uniref:helix-turn-helix domain-containing protein n=1 Tax=Microbacterium galbum TaxID=3075994 RepID=UPI0034600784
MFTEQGYEDVTMEEVALAVGISPRTLFRYFGSKGEIVLAPPTPSGRRLSSACARRRRRMRGRCSRPRSPMLPSCMPTRRRKRARNAANHRRQSGAVRGIPRQDGDDPERSGGRGAEQIGSRCNSRSSVGGVGLRVPACSPIRNQRTPERELLT